MHAAISSALARCGRAIMPSDMEGIESVLGVARATPSFPQRLLWDLEDAYESAAQADFQSVLADAGLV